MAVIKLAETATFGVFILKFIVNVRPEGCTNALAALQGSQRTPCSLWLHIILFCPTAKIFDFRQLSSLYLFERLAILQYLTSN